MGQGLPYPAPAMVAWTGLFDLPPWTGDESTVPAHWYLDGFAPPGPVEIPWAWLSGPIRFRQDKPFTHAAVSKSGAGTAVASVVADEQISYTASLESGNDVDASNLAHFTVTYYDTHRTRLSRVRLVLNDRTVEEIWTILGVGIGSRISITGVPAGFPQGASSLVVEGVRHLARGDAAARIVEWSTAPVIGEEVGEVGPFFRVGVSALGGTDLLPW